MIIQLKSAAEFKEAIHTEATLVEFYAPWCSHCQEEMPIVEKFAEDNPETLVVQVNVDNFPELLQEYGIDAWPNFLLFSHGNLVGQLVGTQSEDALTALLTSMP